MTGNVTILMSKSVLDFFTALIFACSLGIITSVIAVPQFLIFLCLFLLAKLIYPLTTPVMINDFKACGGFILLATGLRILPRRQRPDDRGDELTPVSMNAMVSIKKPRSWECPNK